MAWKISCFSTIQSYVTNIKIFYIVSQKKSDITENSSSITELMQKIKIVFKMVEIVYTYL